MDDRPKRLRRAFAGGVLAIVASACYPTFDWRDYRPDCTHHWCAFTVTVPGRVASATRTIPIDGRDVPLDLHAVSAGGLTFAVGAFDLAGGVDGDRARARFEAKLLDDVGAPSGRSRAIELPAADRTRLAATAFDADGARDGAALHAEARFVARGGRLVEFVVVGPAAAFATERGRLAAETFFSSVRLD